MTDFPSRREQEEAEYYVLKQPLRRPDTDVKKAIKYVSVYMTLSLGFSAVSFAPLKKYEIFAYISESLAEFSMAHPVLLGVLYFAAVFCIVGLLCLKSAAIGIIRMYQHYAPEHVRRRCLFKPTCSEYAILAIQKYGLFIGLFKSYIRLFKKCRGNIYRIDYP
ncbi:MAG: membrane protein insertion efficiency factor YidD [Firmicutes bacterium]|nr:membrane protein insertion efficiency factor YidD [Bacillota bacterium]